MKGYLDPADALVFFSILEGQRRAGMSGGLAEIGIYYGRSFFLLKKLAKEGERVLGIDTSARCMASRVFTWRTSRCCPRPPQ